MTTNDKIGPCPLCGGEAIRDSVGCWCKNGMCEMNQGRQPKLRWQALSTLASREKRMREALERCRDEVDQIARDTCEQSTENSCGHIVDWCEEALKR